jgi:hypothetical protein
LLLSGIFITEFLLIPTYDTTYTYSDHIAIEENTRKEFFSEIEKAIDNLGGQITIYDTIDLQLAKKP